MASGEELIVNQVGEQQQRDPVVAALPGGGWVAAWVDNSGIGGDASRTAIKARIFNADGTPAGSEFLVNTRTEGTQNNPQIAAAAGGFLISWTDNLSDFDSEAKAQVFSLSGVRVGSEFSINSSSTDYQTAGDLTALAGGGYLVTFNDSVGNVQRGRLLGADGAPTGAEFVVGPGGADSVTALPDGGFVVTYSRIFSSSDGAFGQRFDANGAPVGPELSIGPGKGFAPDIAALAGGGWVVSWETANTVDPEVYARIYDSNGGVVGEAVHVNMQTANTQHHSSVIGLPGGGFVVAWEDNGTKTVIGQAFDSSGASRGGPFTINTDTFAGFPQLALLEDGRLLAVWEGGGRAGADTSGTSIHARAYVATTGPTPPSAGPSEGPDALTGGEGRDVVDGLGGDDVLNGGGGDDSLEGGAGDDVLLGGGGSDRLSPGSGIDRLDGGDGIDFLDFGASTTGVYADLSNDSYSTAATFTFLTSIEGLVGGAGDDFLLGDDGFNVLIGGAGVDVLIGRGGDDFLFGEAGDDRLVGGGGHDNMFGGAGADTFDLTGGGWDTAVDFNVAEDRIYLGGPSFLYLVEGDFNGDGVADSQLTYEGGTLVVSGVTGLSVDAWNGLLV